MRGGWTGIVVVLAGLAVVGCSEDDQGTVAGDASGDVAFGDVAPPEDSAVAGDTGGSVGDSATPDDSAAPDDSTASPDTASGPDATTPPDTAGGTDTASDDAPRIEVDPPQYTFSYIAPLTTSPTRQLTIYNLGARDLVITKIAWLPGSSPDFDIALLPPLPKTLAPQKSTLLNVRFRDIAGGTATLRITSNDPARPELDIVFDSYLKSGTATPEPCAQIVPSKLDFGQVQRGNTKTLSATLTNCGATDALVVSAVTRSTFFFLTLSNEFQITNLPTLPTTLAPGASMPIDVAYTPLLAGLDAGSFLFATNDPNEPQLKLDVSAVGTAPPPSEIGLRVKITWNTNSSDEDSHLVMPGGTLFDCHSDCFFANPAPDWGVTGAWQDDPFLDVDDVDGYGPENINISEPMAGTYTFYVHYYSDSHDGSGGGPSATTVELYSFNTLLGTFGPTTTQSTNDVWDVFTVEWPSKVVTALGTVHHGGSGPGMCGFSFP